ncbi:MAG: YtxH domain-containing protein [Thermogemmatispora sp.]|uniref:YtxH domain-containing protein n=1 Tax=Thermogemmatispora sp. TaxID=1968838 RepID=UPI001A0607DF|nr:YtxH domain-containing protein [Thermogemmatispora sp.]MBE3565770.1 YtxH domain-containing protein [Thermogemmatispora sp.]
MAKGNGFAPVTETLKEVRARTADMARTDLSTVQDNVQTVLEPRRRRLLLKRLRGGLRSSSGRVEDQLQQRRQALQRVWRGSRKPVKRSLEEAQRESGRLKNLLSEQLSLLLGALAAGLGLLQVAVERSMRGARGRLERARGNLAEARIVWQQERERRARRRRRARLLFRIGLLVGIVLALLFAPRPGQETRRRLGGYLRNVIAFFQSRPFVRSESETAEHVPLNVR